MSSGFHVGDWVLCRNFPDTVCQVARVRADIDSLDVVGAGVNATVPARLCIPSKPPKRDLAALERAVYDADPTRRYQDKLLREVFCGAPKERTLTTPSPDPNPFMPPSFPGFAWKHGPAAVGDFVVLKIGPKMDPSTDTGRYGIPLKATCRMHPTEVSMTYHRDTLFGPCLLVEHLIEKGDGYCYPVSAPCYPYDTYRKL